MFYYRQVITQAHLQDKYGVLTGCEKQMLENGRLGRETARKLCDATYPDIFVDVMEKFDMLVPHKVENKDEWRSEDVEYLVPCLMKTVQEGNVSVKTDKSVPTLYFQFVHRDLKEKGKEGVFLPQGFFHRLVSRCCRTRKKWRMAKFCYDYMEFSGNGVFCYHAYGLQQHPAVCLSHRRKT